MSKELEEILNEEPLIEKFQIFGLYGDRNVSLHFKGPATVVLGENGSGKTTLLNALFNILTGNWAKVFEKGFKRCELTLKNAEVVIIDCDDMMPQDMAELFYLGYAGRLLKNKWKSKDDFKKVWDSFSALEKHSINVYLNTDIQVDSLLMHDSSMAGYNSQNIKKANNKLESVRKKLKGFLNYKVLYLPTYRRVEEDLQNLLDIKEEILKGDELIQFGMQDIKKRFQDITSEIIKSFVESYSEISGQILTQLVREVDISSINFDKIGNLNILNIVLDRVGDSIKNEDKNLILGIARGDGFKDAKYMTLAYFLSKLIDVYKKQEDNDNSIKNLVRVVNKYFVNSSKELVYNESKVEVQIIDKKSKNEIMVDKLSSGEKQILSIFSKLYLDKTPKSQYIVLIDEPELSLSIEWQRQLLEDIMASSKCALLLATTHSPFVFENKLDKFVTKIRVS